MIAKGRQRSSGCTSSIPRVAEEIHGLLGQMLSAAKKGSNPPTRWAGRPRGCCSAASCCRSRTSCCSTSRRTTRSRVHQRAERRLQKFEGTVFRNPRSDLLEEVGTLGSSIRAACRTSKAARGAHGFARLAWPRSLRTGTFFLRIVVLSAMMPSASDSAHRPVRSCRRFDRPDRPRRQAGFAGDGLDRRA